MSFVALHSESPGAAMWVRTGGMRRWLERLDVRVAFDLLDVPDVLASR